MFSKIISNLILYTISFLLFNYIKKWELISEGTFTASYAVYIVAWAGSGILSRKFRNETEGKLYNIIYIYFIAFFLMLGIITVFILKFHLSTASDFVFYNSLFAAFAYELLYLITKNRNKTNYIQIKFQFSSRALIFEFIIYAGLIFIILNSKLDCKGLNNKCMLLILSLYLSWFIAAVFGHQYSAKYERKDYWNFIWLYIKSYIIIISLNTSISFLLGLSRNDLLIVIQTTAIYTMLALFTITVFYYIKKPGISKNNQPQLKKNELHRNINALPAGISFDEISQYEFPQPESYSVSLNNQLKEVYLNKFPGVYKFLNESINLCSFEVSSSVIQRSNDIDNLEILPENTLELFFNLREVNDLRRINYYLIEINKKLKYGGIFIGKIETINLRYKRFLTSYPYYLARLFYFIDFIWRRVFPKLPGFQKIYFALTNGNNRAISFAEGLGRLVYCGFEVIKAKDLDNFVYFVAKKIRQPYNDPNPSYGPLFKMRRIGKNGKPIYVYKFRTMHPYAEYLQDYVLRKHGYSEIGKPAEDFRVTKWGKILRKYWLDELPQLINVFKGEMKLVGIRPISQRFLNEFPDEFKQLRYKHKPGCIPAYVALLKQSKNGFIEAESIYLKEMEKHPVLVDIKYMFKAIYNIVTNKIRSA